MTPEKTMDEKFPLVYTWHEQPINHASGGGGLVWTRVFVRDEDHVRRDVVAVHMYAQYGTRILGRVEQLPTNLWSLTVFPPFSKTMELLGVFIDMETAMGEFEHTFCLSQTVPTDGVERWLSDGWHWLNPDWAFLFYSGKLTVTRKQKAPEAIYPMRNRT